MKKFYSFLLLFALLIGAGNAWGEEITVADKTNYNSNCPLYGNWADAYQRCQVIYLSSELTALSGKNITGMTFYLKTKPTKAWSGSEYHILLSEVTASLFSGSWNTETTGTEVLTCASLDGTSGTMTLTFTTPYTYNGGNLLFELQDKGTGAYANSSFYGDSNLGNRSASGYSSTSFASVSATNRAFLPKTTFTYEEAAAGGCAKPKALTQGAVTATSATFTWTKGGDETEWQWVCLPAATDVDWSSPAVKTATSATATATGLNASTNYKFYVRANCGSEQSAEVSKAFTTPCVDYAIEDMPFEQNFNGLTAGTGLIPDCWSKVANGNYPYIYSSGGVDNSKSLYFSGGASATSSIIILPHFEAPTNSLVISLAYKNNSTSSSYGQFKIGYMTNPEDASTFMPLKSLTRNNTWTEENKFALTSAPANSYIAIQYGGGSSTGSAYLDNVKVAIPSSCTDPSGLTAVAASATSATVSWTENGSAEAWNIQYSTNNFASHTDINGVTTNPYTLTGLSSNTTYKVRVQADCGSEQSDWIASGEFTTPCAGVDGIGWSADFAGASTGSAAGLPGCWVKNSTNTYPYIYNYGARSNSRCLYFSAGSGVKPIAVLPPFNEKTNTLFVTLWYNNAYDYGDYCSESHGQLEIGFMTNPADASTFTAQEVLPRVCTYTQAKVALTNAPERSRVAIRYVGGSTTGYAFVDDIGITAIPSCVAPSGVSGSAISYNRASVSWTENGSATAWKIQYSSNNGVSWSGEISATTNPYTLTGLSGNITYIARVKAECGGDYSDWSSNSASFNTPCEPADASDFSETFESVTPGGGNLPDCWQYKDIYNNWGDDYPFVYNSGAYQGSKLLYFYGGGAESVNTVLLPPMDAPLNGLTIEFYYNTSLNIGSVVYATPVLGYIAADGTTFVEIETLDQSADYILYKKDLSTVPPTAKYLAISYAKGTAGSGHMYIDNVRVYTTPTCVEPTGVSASDETATSAVIAWTAGGSETAWKLQYSTDGTNWTDANGGANVTNPYTLTGLTPNRTTYYARVKAVCSGSDESIWSAFSDPFQTECAAISLPFSEDFSGADLGCWSPVDCDSHTGLYNQTFRFYYSTNPPQYLISPEIDTEGKNTRVEFEYRAESSSYAETFKVGYSTTTNDIASFAWSAEQTATNTSALTYSQNLPAGVTYVAIQYTSNDKYYLYIDNFRVSEKPACSVPTELEASAVTANSATITWLAGDEETAWNLQYKTAEGSWSEAIAVASTPSYNLTGLNANALYYVRVLANCGGAGASEYTDGTFSFATPCEEKTLGWAEYFDAQSSLPACWEATATGTSGNQWSIDVYESHSGNNSAKYNGRTNSSYSADLVTPSITISENASLSFWYKNAVTAEVYVNDGTSTTKLWDIASSGDWKDKTISLVDYVGKTVTFIFRGHGYSTSSTKYLYLDDIRVLRSVTLADNEDNSAVLASLNGQTVNATINRTIYCDGDYNTICLPFSLATTEGTPLEGATVYAYKYAVIEPDELQVRIYESENGIQAGVPYLLKKSDSDNLTSMTFTGVTIAAAAGQSIGAEGPVSFIGILKPQPFVANDETTLFVSTENNLAWASEDSNLKSFRAYFKRNDNSAGAPLRPGMRARIVLQEQVATGVDNTSGNTGECFKLIENEQLVIIRNGVKYNVQGQVIR